MSSIESQFTINVPPFTSIPMYSEIIGETGSAGNGLPKAPGGPWRVKSDGTFTNFFQIIINLSNKGLPLTINRSPTLYNLLQDYTYSRFLTTGPMLSEDDAIVKTLPDDEELLTELRTEADFYGFEFIVTAIDKKLTLLQILNIDVSGTLYETRYVNFYQIQDTNLFDIVTSQLKNDIVQIDRDGPSFGYVLNYLRDILKVQDPDTVKPIIPNTSDALDTFRDDVNFYGIETLVTVADAKIERFTDITLNVGGQSFQTHLNTLLLYPTSRLATIVRDAFFNENQTNIYIDRDNTNFQTILDFLASRDPFDYSEPVNPVTIPTELDLRQRLLRELEYYGISPLQNKVKSLINNNVYQIQTKIYKVPFNQDWINYTESIVQGNQELLDEQSQNGLKLMNILSYESQVTQTTKMRYYEFTFKDPAVDTF